MSEKIENTLSVLNNTAKGGLVDVKALTQLPFVAEKFISLYNNVNNSQSGELVYHAETLNFTTLVNSNPNLKKCTPVSLYQTFINAAVNNLSFSEHKKQVYIVPNRDTAKLWITPYGEAQLRIDRGVIKHYDSPVLVYDCDEFSKKLVDNDTVLNHTPIVPTPKDANIIASYIKITRSDNTFYFEVFDISFFINLRDNYSKQKNSLAWRDLPAMIKAKTIKHAFHKMPVIAPKGVNIQLEPQGEDESVIDYGVAEEIENTEEF